MPRPAKPPRLYLRERKGRESIYVILDRGNEVSTHCGPDRQREAEEAFARYLGEKHAPNWGNGDPARVAVADVLTLYMTTKAPDHACPEDVGFRAGPLLDFFGAMTCWDITEPTCKAYTAFRERGSADRRPVKAATARRELETLRAALNYAQKARKLNQVIPVWLPDKSAARLRWLTRSEAARLLAGALGFSPVEIDSRGRVKKWAREGKPSYHVARFILIGLYTGTRHESILRMRWGVNSDGGWFDLQTGIMHRRGEGQRDTKKRRTPAPIPGNLLPHLHRWRRLTVNGPCEFRDQITKRQKTGFERARDLAKLGPDVTPHVLKHTCITWMYQRGVPEWEISGFTATSVETLRRVYGHQSADHMAAASATFRGHNLGQKAQGGAT